MDLFAQREVSLEGFSVKVPWKLVPQLAAVVLIVIVIAGAFLWLRPLLLAAALAMRVAQPTENSNE